MVENGYVSQSDGEEAKKQPLGVTARTTGPSLFASDYFAESVRRQLIDQYGEKVLYEGGLSVRTSLDPQMQLAARKALQDGLVTYDERRGFHGPIKQIDASGDWGKALADIPTLSDVPEWRLAVVLAVSDSTVDIGLQQLPRMEAARLPPTASAARSTPRICNGPSVRPTAPARPRNRRLAPWRLVTSFMSQSSATTRRLPTACSSRRRCRVAWSPWIRRPAACWPWSAASPTPSPNSTAPPRRCVSQAPRSSPSSTPRQWTMVIRLSLRHHGCADRNRLGRPGLEAGKLRRRIRRPVDAAFGHRAFAQSDDGAPRQRSRHEHRRRICRALRHLRSHAAGSFHVARR